MVVLIEGTRKQLTLWLERKVVRCPRCGADIVVMERVSDGEVASEYRGKDDLCWECSFSKKAKTG